MSLLTAFLALTAAVLITALPNDLARRGGSHSMAVAGQALSMIVPGLCFAGLAAIGLIQGLTGVVVFGSAMLAGNVLADRLATRKWGPASSAPGSMAQ